MYVDNYVGDFVDEMCIVCFDVIYQMCSVCFDVAYEIRLPPLYLLSPLRWLLNGMTEMKVPWFPYWIVFRII